MLGSGVEWDHNSGRCGYVHTTCMAGTSVWRRDYIEYSYQKNTIIGQELATRLQAPNALTVYIIEAEQWPDISSFCTPARHAFLRTHCAVGRDRLSTPVSEQVMTGRRLL